MYVLKFLITSECNMASVERWLYCSNAMRNSTIQSRRVWTISYGQDGYSIWWNLNGYLSNFWWQPIVAMRSYLIVFGQLACLQLPKCTGLFHMHNSNKRNAEPPIRALNCHSILYWQWCTIWRQSSWSQKLIYNKKVEALCRTLQSCRYRRKI